MIRWILAFLLRNEPSLMAGFRIVPWPEFARRFKAHGWDWRKYP